MRFSQASPHSITQTLAHHLQNIFVMNNSLLGSIITLVPHEIKSNLSGTTLFRENNVCTYMLTCFTRDVAVRSGYLARVLKEPLSEMMASKKSFEFSGEDIFLYEPTKTKQNKTKQ
jgi:hypothetical protein